MKYSEFLDIVKPFAEKTFADFQKKLIATNYRILGVRTPVLRKLAKKYAENMEEILAFPDEYYEIVFIKLAMVSALSYEKFLLHLEKCVSLIDNWGLCDCFKAKCIKKHKDEFLPVLANLFENKGVYYVRYVLVTLLFEYMEEKYLPILEDYIKRTDTTPYYIHMAVAWLLAEILIQHYPFGISLLKKGLVDIKTHNKGIQKATESYRLSTEQKEYLRTLKIK